MYVCIEFGRYVDINIFVIKEFVEIEFLGMSTFIV